MDPRALELLELPEILDRLAGVAGSEPGRLQALALRPSADPDEVAARQALTTEASRSSTQPPSPTWPVPATCEAGSGGRRARQRARHRRASHDRRVDRRRGRRRRVALESADDVPGLHGSRAASSRGSSGVADAIATGGRGRRLRPHATARRPRLRRLRRELRDGRGRLAERLRELARDPALREHLQDDFVTERGGRPVLAAEGVRSRQRSRASSTTRPGSGQTLFVEPFAVVERLEPARARPRAPSARRSRGSCASSRVARRRARRRADGARRRGRRARPRARARDALAALAGSAGDGRATRSSCAVRGTRCSTRPPPSRSTSSSAASGRS